MTCLENWKQTMEHESDSDTNCNRYAQYSYQMIDKKTGGFRNNEPIGDHPNYSIIKIGQNTEKSSGDLKRLAVTQTLVKDHQLTPLWKTLKGILCKIIKYSLK